MRNPESILEIIISIGREKDKAKLLELILSTMMDFTGADGGTLYLRDGDRLSFHIMKNGVFGHFQGKRH
jgi:hypothetical protein